jgi:hypothetical protein
VILDKSIKIGFSILSFEKGEFSFKRRTTSTLGSPKKIIIPFFLIQFAEPLPFDKFREHAAR